MKSKHLIAALFLLQLALPLAASLQMLDGLRDLLSVQLHASVPPSEPTSTPTIGETTSDSTDAPVVTPLAICGVSAPSTAAQPSTRVWLASTPLLFSTPQVQRSVLRV